MMVTRQEILVKKTKSGSQVIKENCKKKKKINKKNIAIIALFNEYLCIFVYIFNRTREEYL